MWRSSLSSAFRHPVSLQNCKSPSHPAPNFPLSIFPTARRSRRVKRDCKSWYLLCELLLPKLSPSFTCYPNVDLCRDRGSQMAPGQISVLRLRPVERSARRRHNGLTVLKIDRSRKIGANASKKHGQNCQY